LAFVKAAPSGAEAAGHVNASPTPFFGTNIEIVVADDLPASALDLLRTEGWKRRCPSCPDAEQLAADVADADAIVVRSATKVTSAIIGARSKASRYCPERYRR
jgi:hypothetical protein